MIETMETVKDLEIIKRYGRKRKSNLTFGYEVRNRIRDNV